MYWAKPIGKSLLTQCTWLQWDFPVDSPPIDLMYWAKPNGKSLLSQCTWLQWVFPIDSSPIDLMYWAKPNGKSLLTQCTWLQWDFPVDSPPIDLMYWAEYNGKSLLTHPHWPYMLANNGKTHWKVPIESVYLAAMGFSHWLTSHWPNVLGQNPVESPIWLSVLASNGKNPLAYLPLTQCTWVKAIESPPLCWEMVNAPYVESPYGPPLECMTVLIHMPYECIRGLSAWEIG